MNTHALYPRCKHRGIIIKIKGYHPFVIAITDSNLVGDKYLNIFGQDNGEDGLAVFTTNNVDNVIIPHDKMTAYYLYYLARYTFGFIEPKFMNHDETRGCVFDRKIKKSDIIKSMKSRSICDPCRKQILKKESKITSSQLDALDRMFFRSGRLLENTPEKTNKKSKKIKIFIGSSMEGLEVARKIQADLSTEFDAEIWNQGTVFGLGDVPIEALEQAVASYDFGIFIFTPDDELNQRGEVRHVARDNVIFELGLFIGKLTRRRAFIVKPENNISLPSDLKGITAASYDSMNSNRAVALGPSCDKIRDTISRELNEISNA